MTILFGLGAAAVWANLTIVLTPLSRALSSIRLMLGLLVANLFATGLGALLLESDRGVSARPVAIAAAAGVLEVLGTFAWIRAVRVGAVAIVTPIIGLEGGVAALIAVGFGYHVTLMLGVGLAIAAAGAALTASEGRAKTAAGAGWATLSATAFGSMLVLYAHTHPLGALTSVAVAHVAAVAVVLPLAITLGEATIARRYLVRVAASGALDGGGFCLFAVAAAHGPVATASVCAAQFSTLGAVLGIIVFRDRPRLHQTLGIAAAAIGTTTIGLFG